MDIGGDLLVRRVDRSGEDGGTRVPVLALTRRASSPCDRKRSSRGHLGFSTDIVVRPGADRDPGMLAP
jgi:hypothetical protein